MQHETIKDWRDALAKISTEQLPDCEIKTDRDQRIEIYFPEQDHKNCPFMSVEIERAGRLKHDRICICKFGRMIRNYETEEQFARNIAKVVAQVRADYVKAKEEERIKAERQQAEQERKDILEKVADMEARLAFSNHNIESFDTIGHHRGGKVRMDFPDIKDETGFVWHRTLVLEYRANEENELTWAIGKDMRIGIPDLAAFSKTIY